MGAVAADLAASSWEELLGVRASRARRSTGPSRCSARRDAAFFCGRWGSRTTRTASTRPALATWAGARLARPAGLRLLPIRGHSNVQGVGSCGVTPGLKQGVRGEAARSSTDHGHAGVGQDTYSSLVAAAEGRHQACGAARRNI